MMSAQFSSARSQTGTAMSKFSFRATSVSIPETRTTASETSRNKAGDAIASANFIASVRRAVVRVIVESNARRRRRARAARTGRARPAGR